MFFIHIYGNKLYEEQDQERDGKILGSGKFEFVVIHVVVLVL